MFIAISCNLYYAVKPAMHGLQLAANGVWYGNILALYQVHTL